MNLEYECPGACVRCNLRINGHRNPQLYKSEDYDCQNAKKSKNSICICCLGLLQPEFWSPMLNAISNQLSKTRYDSDTFACGLSFPPCIMIREYSIDLYMKENHPNYKTGDLIPLKQAWKWSFGEAMSTVISKSLDSGAISQFLITIHTNYNDDALELEPLKEMCPQVFIERIKCHKKYRGEDYSRVSVENILSKIDASTFKKFFDCPPNEPKEMVECKMVECFHNPIYLGGRYLKFSRELSQTPWIIDGKRIMEGSIQEIIFQPLTQVLGIPPNCVDSRLKFISSGREDVDVRCLGNGRPFVVEINNPPKSSFSTENLEVFATSMSVHPNLVRVNHLQMIPKNNLQLLKLGEETKTKTYEALCVILKDENCEVNLSTIKNYLDIINSYSNTENKTGVVIMQKTPLRVLHRRPLLNRSRMVHSMKASSINDKEDMFILELTTQAGTYIKEFVHGDFGRTTPNISQILGIKVDILALDVTSVNLEWP